MGAGRLVRWTAAGIQRPSAPHVERRCGFAVSAWVSRKRACSRRSAATPLPEPVHLGHIRRHARNIWPSRCRVILIDMTPSVIIPAIKSNDERIDSSTSASDSIHAIVT